MLREISTQRLISTQNIELFSGLATNYEDNRQRFLRQILQLQERELKHCPLNNFRFPLVSF
jgi:hypothetical protein